MGVVVQCDVMSEGHMTDSLRQQALGDYFTAVPHLLCCMRES